MEIPFKPSNAPQDSQMLIIPCKTYNETSPNYMYSSRIQANPKIAHKVHKQWHMHPQNIALKYKQTSTRHIRTQTTNIVPGQVMLHATDSSHAAYSKENIVMA